MKLYAVRDRMVGYFMQPFAAPGDNQVLAAVATQVNAGDHNVIAQAPHHFEIWTLADIDEENGKVTPALEFLADCNTLIRGGVRTERDTGGATTKGTPGLRPGAPGGDRSGATAQDRSRPSEAPGRPEPPQPADPTAERGNL